MDTMQLPLPLDPTAPEVLDALTAYVRENKQRFDYWRQKEMRNTEVFGVFKFIGAGAYRAAFSLGDIVVKVARSDRTHQSEWEWKTWQNSPPELRQYLVPILFHDETNHQWTIMPKCNTNFTFQTRSRNAQELRKKVYRSIGDIHDENVGKLNGKWVILDYGG